MPLDHGSNLGSGQTRMPGAYRPGPISLLYVHTTNNIQLPSTGPSSEETSPEPAFKAAKTKAKREEPLYRS